MKSKFLTPRNVILIFILINLICGLFIVSDFGRSPDEIYEETEVINALNGFSSWEKLQKYQELDKKSNATAPYLVFTFIENIVNKILNPPPGVIKHFLYFVSFQVGIYSFFIVAKKILNEWTALVMTLLFGTQPLYFGHALMNPKDIPFMAVFLTTIASGFYMADRLIPLLSKAKRSVDHGIKKSIAKNWRNLSRGERNILILSNLMWLLFLLIYKISPLFIGLLIHKVYYSSDESILRSLFQHFASRSDSIPITSYISKAQLIFDRYLIYFFLIYLILEIVLLLRFLPSIYEWLWHSLIEPHAAVFINNKRGYWNPILFAGLALGFCISSRIIGQVIGLAAGGLVGLYLLFNLREKALFPLIFYSLFAGISLYLFWPNIWFSGFSGFIRMIKANPKFTWAGGVLYDGVVYPYNTLPRSYFPHLISIQFTEPAIILGLLGILLGGILIKKRKLDPIPFLILFAWFFLPILYSIVFQPTHYNAFRQYLFVTPPLFIFAGISFNEIVQLIKRKWISVVLSVLILVPGIFSLFQLHPYQYIYYNSFVGGVEGAFRRFDLDYWLISYKEAIEYLNQVAPKGAKIVHWRDGEILEYYARDDLELTNQNQIDYRSIKDFDYGIITSSLNADTHNLLSAELVFQVKRDNAVLVVVRKIK